MRRWKSHAHTLRTLEARSCDKFISVLIKLKDENNSGGNIATMKWCATDINGFVFG